jgi:hypothetical protein
LASRVAAQKVQKRESKYPRREDEGLASFDKALGSG